MADKIQLKQIRSVGLKELSDLSKAGLVKPKSPDYAPVPMFLPTRTFGRNVVQVITRQSFMDTNIQWWVKWRVMLVLSLLSAAAAVALVFVNGYLATLAGLVAGWAYGQYVWAGFYVNNLLKNRRLLETT